MGGIKNPDFLRSSFMNDPLTDPLKKSLHEQMHSPSTLNYIITIFFSTLISNKRTRNIMWNEGKKLFSKWLLILDKIFIMGK